MTLTAARLLAAHLVEQEVTDPEEPDLSAMAALPVDRLTAHGHALDRMEPGAVARAA